MTRKTVTRIVKTEAERRISSPEQLGERMKVPSVLSWCALLSLAALVLGAFAWGIFARLETTLPALIVTDGARSVCYVRETDANRLRMGQTARDGESEYAVASLPGAPVPANEALSENARAIFGVSANDAVCAFLLNGAPGEGARRAEVVTEIIAPISFIINESGGAGF